MIKSTLASVVTSLLIIIIYHFLFNTKTSYVFIDNTKIYEGFSMKVRYQKDIENQMLTNKNKLDSLQLQLKMLVMQEETQPNVELKNQINNLNNRIKQFQAEATESASALAERYENQIWSQINQYVKEFGKEHDVKIIFGATGNGSLMYADDASNYTDEVLEYINTKYEKGE